MISIHIIIYKIIFHLICKSYAQIWLGNPFCGEKLTKFGMHQLESNAPKLELRVMSLLLHVACLKALL